MIPSTWTTSDLWSALQRAVGAREPYAWLVDIKPLGMSVVYGTGGRTYESSFAVADDGTITLGDSVEVRSQTVYWPAESVAFSSSTDSAGRVRWTGLIFRAGRFPERPIREITADDLDAMVGSFPNDGVPILIDHNPRSFLVPALEKDGARVRRIWRQGDELHGEVEVPGWFASAARDLWKSVSVGLDGTLRRLNELSFVSSPRIEDAAVFAGSPAFTHFAQAHPDLAAGIRPPAPPAHDRPKSTMPVNPSFIERMLGWFRRLPAEERAGVTEIDLQTAFSTATPGDPASPTSLTTDPAVEARLRELEQRFAEQNAVNAAATRRNAALAFYETHLRAGRVTPDKREAIVAEHEAAQIADESQKFAADSPQSFVRGMEERYSKLPVTFNLGGQRIDGRTDSNPEKGQALGIFSDQDFAAAFGRKEAK